MCGTPPPPLARATPLSEQQEVLFPSNFGTLVLLSQGGGGTLIPELMRLIVLGKASSVHCFLGQPHIYLCGLFVDLSSTEDRPERRNTEPTRSMPGCLQWAVAEGIGEHLQLADAQNQGILRSCTACYMTFGCHQRVLY